MRQTPYCSSESEIVKPPSPSAFFDLLRDLPYYAIGHAELYVCKGRRRLALNRHLTV